MNIKTGNRMMVTTTGWLRKTSLWLILLVGHMTAWGAANLSLSAIDVASTSGNNLQIQMEMSGMAFEPKVFQTDNPARIALDFPGVSNGLGKKMYPVNQGGVSSIYVAEAADRVRVVVNLLESSPYQVKITGNKVLLSLSGSQAANSYATPDAQKPYIKKSTPSSVAAGLIPEQGIRGIDFKRGDNGEGRILVSLANPDTIVNTRQEGGNVVVSFINTKLPSFLSKRLDVSEFATPVKTISTMASSRETTIVAGMQNNLYDYSLFQSEGLLTIEFRPLTTEEKEILDSKREKYKGDRLSLNFQDIDIRSVIAILAEFTGQNVVAGDEVAGTITLKMDDVPWDEALDFIMMTKGLEKYESGNVILVAPVGKIKEYKEKQEATERVVQQMEPLTTEYIKINYSRAENFKNLLNGNDTGAFGACSTSSNSASGSSSGSTSSSIPSTLSTQGNQFGQQNGQNAQSGQNNQNGNNDNDKFRILTSRGSAVVDSRTNTLILRETAKNIEEAKKLIRRLDVPVRQVMIEVRIASASNTFAKQLGVRFGAQKLGNAGPNTVFGIGGTQTRGSIGTSSTTITDTSTVANGTVTPSATITRTSTPESVSFLSDAAKTGLVDLATTATPYGALGMTLARGADYVLNLELQALQDQNQGELLSNPRVLTSDRCKATIKQGVQIPYQSTSGNFGTTTIFVDAALVLDVLPQITPSGSVVMSLKVTKDSPTVVASATAPGINTQQLETNVHVMDGETLVLGGVFQETLNNNRSKVPFFGDLPGIGFLFNRTQKQDDKNELLIFVTPKIVRDNATLN